MAKESEIKKHKVAVNDPRPQWMQDFHNETRGGSLRFKDWARQSLHIDINKQLRHDTISGKTSMAGKINEAISAGNPFMLYQDHTRSCIVFPKIRTIISIFPGQESSIEILDDRQFQNRVKMLYVIYPSFDYPDKVLVRAAMKMLFLTFTPRLIS